MGRAVLALCGAAVVLWEPELGIPLPSSAGDWLGLIGGLGFALVNVILRRQADTPATDRALAMAVGGLTIIIALIQGMAAHRLVQEV